MNYHVLARKWRPKKFQDVIGQGHVIRSLQNAILKNKLGHAYIFAGTRGVGKTTVARLLGKAIRCEKRDIEGNPCGQCSSCSDFDTGSSMNVLEIDGASNNSVDDVRDLIANVEYLPSFGDKKIYIIDEIHMLSTSAFNALLKTLEEPPEHIIFIFATTDPEKLLGTVLSRCQRFDFRHVSLQDLVDHVNMIAEHEDIKFENEKLVRQLCSLGKGSVRDTLSLLDQVLSFAGDKHIDEEVLLVSLGVARLTSIRKMVTCILTGDVRECSDTFKKLLYENVDVSKIVIAVLDYFYELVESISDVEKIYKKELLPASMLSDISESELFWIYESLVKDSTWALNSIAAEQVVDVVFQKICLRRTFFYKDVGFSQTEKKMVDSEVKEEKKEFKKEEPKLEKERPQIEPKIEPKIEPQTELMRDSQTKSESKDWDGFLKFLYSHSLILASNLEQSNILSPVDVTEGQVKIDLGFGNEAKVFMEYLQDSEVKNKLLNYLADFFQSEKSKINLSFVLLDDSERKESNFVSKFDVKKQEEEERDKKRKKDFANHPMINEAELLFNNKVDKIILNNDSVSN